MGTMYIFTPKKLVVDEIMLTFATLDPIVPATRHTLGLVFYKVHP